MTSPDDKALAKRLGTVAVGCEVLAHKLTQGPAPWPAELVAEVLTLRRALDVVEREARQRIPKRPPYRRPHHAQR